MPVRLLATMSSRDPDEPHRASTPLELFFDLTFVVAVAQASNTMHHLLVDGHAGDGLVAFPLVFFGIWWAWMNFTWFASAYDPDDAAYRVTVLVQMAGVLVFAAGVPRLLEDLDLGVTVAGYVIMRIGAVTQWLRAAAQDPDRRPGTLRYAMGIASCQAGWVALAAVAPDSWLVPGFVALALVELAVPVWAERRAPTNWHPGHIGERYGLFTLLVLGESVLSATAAMETALDEGGPFGDLVTTAVGGFLVVAGMWWVYFDQPVGRLLSRAREAFSSLDETQSFVWGYGHYLVFASAATVGVGLAVAVDQAVGRSTLTDLEAALTLTVPVTVYLLTVWLLHWRYKTPGLFRVVACPVTATLVLASSWSGEPALLTGLAVAALVVGSLLAHETPAGPSEEAAPAREAEPASDPAPASDPGPTGDSAPVGADLATAPLRRAERPPRRRKPAP
jgi:low temperature requirement protein LtrA